MGFGFTNSFADECSWSLAVLSCLLCCTTPEDHGAVRLSQIRADAGRGQDLTNLFSGGPDLDALKQIMMPHRL